MVRPDGCLRRRRLLFERAQREERDAIGLSDPLAIASQDRASSVLHRFFRGLGSKPKTAFSTRGKMKKFGHTQSSLLWAGASLPRLWVALTSFRSLVLGLAPRPRYGSPQYRDPLVRLPTVRASVSLHWVSRRSSGVHPSSVGLNSIHSLGPLAAPSPSPPATPALASLAWRLALAPSPPATPTLPLSVFHRSRWSLASTHPTAPASSPPATSTLPLVRLHPLPLVARLNAIARSARSANHAPALRRTSSVIRPQTAPLGLPPFRSALPFRLRCAGLRPVGGRNALRP